MPEIAHSFDDSIAYEKFMACWSRALGQIFLHWADPPADVRWLDVGCGTGILTELILATCSPATICAVDPSTAQIDHARRQPVGKLAEFQVASAQALPFADASFDVVASALVINFISDRPRALSEMRRVTRPRGVVAGCLWNFEAELSPSWPLRRAMRRTGAHVPQIPGTEHSSIGMLISLFECAGFEEIATTSITVTTAFADFDDFWQTQTPGYAPMTKIIDAMPNEDRARLMEAVRVELLPLCDGRIEYSAEANAIKARSPS